MKIASGFVYTIMMSIFILVSQINPLDYSFVGETIQVSGASMPISMYFIIFAPISYLLLGTFFGVLTKRRIRISTDGLAFNDETRNLTEFRSVYQEGSESSNELAGNLTSYHAWTSFLIVTTILAVSVILIFPLIIIPPPLITIYLTISCGFLYPIGYYLIKKASPILSSMLNNPLLQPLTKYLRIEDVLQNLEECQYVDNIIVKYRHAESDVLNLIDDVQVFIVTNTMPILEIEVSLESIQIIGLELIFTLGERSKSQKEEIITVDGIDALLTVKDTGMNTIVTISSSMDKLGYRLAPENAKMDCKLLETLLIELTQHISELKETLGISFHDVSDVAKEVI